MYCCFQSGIAGDTQLSDFAFCLTVVFGSDFRFSQAMNALFVSKDNLSDLLCGVQVQEVVEGVGFPATTPIAPAMRSDTIAVSLRMTLFWPSLTRSSIVASSEGLIICIVTWASKECVLTDAAIVLSFFLGSDICRQQRCRVRHVGWAGGSRLVS